MDKVKDFLHFCHLLHTKGYVSGSGGNVSQKIGERIVITPTGRALGLLTEDDLVWIEADGTYTNGKPSKEVKLHQACYNARPDVTAVVHVHSIYSIAVTCRDEVNAEDAMPHYTPGYSMRIGSLPNHGLVTCGKSLEEAFDIMEEVEKNAHLYYILDGKGCALSAEQENDLR